MQSDLTELVLQALHAWKEAQQATEDAVEIMERADMEGWLHEPSARCHIRDSEERANAAWAKANALRDAVLAIGVPTSSPATECETGEGERQGPTSNDRM
ncbi:hypothetical protein [Novosphingobium olei]|uniref:Uncharacterized protein n=1 Tax=Novosphingobium olei TaxID=2728851 RepID=A0A7Y0GAJ2_9SPHN|nr:hypothetical protein [Novosphingobium olei]NML93984.1 hypothetical protein [Novosphingobium olei]